MNLRTFASISHCQPQNFTSDKDSSSRVVVVVERELKIIKPLPSCSFSFWAEAILKFSGLSQHGPGDMKVRQVAVCLYAKTGEVLQ